MTNDNDEEIQHPLRIGGLVKSVSGEYDDPDDGYKGLLDESGRRYTGPNAVGRIVSHDVYDEQGHTYGVQFENGTFVFLDQHDLAADDPRRYVLVTRCVYTVVLICDGDGARETITVHHVTERSADDAVNAAIDDRHNEGTRYHINGDGIGYRAAIIQADVPVSVR